MKRGELTGVVPILQVPFLGDGRVDHGSMAQITEWMLEQRVDGIGFGFASELRRLTDAEIDDALRVVVRAAKGVVPVVAAVGSGSTESTRSRVVAAMEIGADAALLPPPHQGQGGPAVVEAVASIAEATGAPLVLQDAPIQTSINLHAGDIVSIARIPEVIALKLEAPPTVPKIEAVLAGLEGDSIPVFGGAGGQDYFYELLAGAAGTMPGSAFPRAFVSMTKLHQAGEIEACADWFRAYLPLIAMCRRSSDTFAFAHKELLRRRGLVESALLRQPAAALPDSVVRDLDWAVRFAESGSGQAVG